MKGKGQCKHSLALTYREYISNVVYCWVEKLEEMMIEEGLKGGKPICTCMPSGGPPGAPKAGGTNGFGGKKISRRYYLAGGPMGFEVIENFLAVLYRLHALPQSACPPGALRGPLRPGGPMGFGARNFLGGSTWKGMYAGREVT